MIAKKGTETAVAAAEPKPAVFTKQQLLEAARYKEKSDLLETLLKDGKSYCFQETDKIIEAYMKGKVK